MSIAVSDLRFVVGECGHGNIISHLPTLLKSYTQVINAS